MSRSYRHTPIFGSLHKRSSKWYKTMIHRQERARFRNALARGFDHDEEIQFLPVVDLDVEFAPFNAWDDPRDGKHYTLNFYPHAGFGVHHDNRRWKSLWTKEEADKTYEKCMRK